MQSDYQNTCKTYKKLIREWVDTYLLPPADYPYWQKDSPDHRHWRERYKEVKSESKEGKCVHLERIKEVDEELMEVSNSLKLKKGPFFGYDIGNGHLAKNYYDVSNWIGNIKNTKRLTDSLDIKNAIYEEMARQEKEKGLVLETPGVRGETDSTLYFDSTTHKVIFKKRKSKLPLPQGYTTTFASMFIRAWGDGKPLTQKEMLVKAGRWKDRQDKPLKRDRQWLYDRVHPIRVALQSVKVNMPQATQDGYAPPKEPTKFLILSKK